MSILEFNSQVEKSSKMMYSFAYNLTKNMEDARDLIQDTIYRALLHRDKFRMDTNLKAWLYTIMRNIFINNYRREMKQRAITDETQNQFYLGSLATSSSNHGEMRVELLEIEKAIAQVDENIRTPFLMYFEGYKYDEIASHLRIPLGTVKSRIFFARRELQHRLRRQI